MESYLEDFLQTEAISQELGCLIKSPAKRRTLYREILTNPLPFRSLLLLLLKEEISFREALWHGNVEDSEDYFEGIYQCMFILSLCKNPSDSISIWEVQYLNQDIGEIEVGNFIGAGVIETLSYLEKCQNKNAPEIAKYIRESLDYPNVEEWIEIWKSDCRESINRI